MTYNSYPLRNILPKAVLGGALLLAACDGTENGATQPGPSPTESNKTGNIAPGQVCEGFFTSTLPDGNILVVGRPVMGSNGMPAEVNVNQSGVTLTDRPKTEGQVAWYSLKGAAQQIPDCHDATLHPKQIEAPSGSVWAATTNPNATPPARWDWQALSPETFGGAGLDYGLVSTHGLGQIIAQAQRP